MKDFFGQTILTENSTFTLATANVYHALNSFHSHRELELIYIHSGQGSFSIGQSSKRIASGTIILIGASTPHMFKFETNRYYDYAMKHGWTPVPLELLTLHFDPNKMGQDFLNLPENKLLNKLLSAAKIGLQLDGKLKTCVIKRMKQLENCQTYEQLPILLLLMNEIATSQDISQNFENEHIKPFKKIDETRLSRIYLYTMDNFYKDIKLADIVAIVYMVPNAFCHYFKSRTGRSYFDFLIEVRIEHACKLLRDGNESVSNICTSSGFNNISNFNRYFKQQTGSSPITYRQEHRK
ncbi:AraC family transcriptional regulator [Sphingobacterium sp. SRCM116780]|uniref:AraC family transcriptional regulator n=1 Tax=Sphingobacterium sp. SRCM116780 TaxID=2907623 RepID=UPI001F302546|nr:AraC family transcriptional regulator [Sphingobacterium sp. SRCM116780]UIR56641.1 AraC family transcriptional regulator [Sphingobacterium sp. SRCM116780]